ncbi:MAG: hypothetical protein AAB449_00855 [Patescibacteria group bacterium]
MFIGVFIGGGVGLIIGNVLVMLPTPEFRPDFQTFFHQRCDHRTNVDNCLTYNLKVWQEQPPVTTRR